MSQLLLSRLEGGARTLLPGLSTGLLLVLNVFPPRLPHLPDIPPPFILMAIWFWALHRPAAMLPGLAFLLGIIMDMVAYGRPGVHALIFTLSCWLVTSQRRFLRAHSFPVLWWGFSMLVLVALVAEWALTSLLGWTLYGIGPVLWQALLGAALYPPVGLALHHIHRWAMVPGEAADAP